MLLKRHLGNGIAKLDGVKIDTTRIESRSVRNLIFKGIYESDERKLLKALCRDADRVLEIGAGVGVVGLVAARLCSKGHVVSYEANPQMRAILDRNYSLNEHKPQLVCMPVTRDGLPVRFHVNENIISSSALERPGTETVEVTLESVSLTDALNNCNPHLVVMDVEGFEDILLRHANLQSVKKLLVEFHPQILGEKVVSDLKQYINEIGFEELATAGNNVSYIKPEQAFLPKISGH